MKKIIGILIFLSLTGMASAQSHFTVEAKIQDNYVLIGSPKLIKIMPGKKATASVSNAFDFSVVVHKKTDKTAVVAVNLMVNGKELNPILEVYLGSEASVAVGDTKLSLLVTESDI